MSDWTNQRHDHESKRKYQEILLIALSVPAMIAGAVFLYFIGRFALIGQHPFQFFADSNTYHDIYSGFMATPEGFIDVSYNFAGPLLILNLTRGNIYLVMMVNVVLFITSMIYICRVIDLNPVKASLIQFISPMTAFSLLSVNKEIIVFPVIALLIAAYRSRSLLLVMIALAVSVLARWQLTVFCLVLVGLYFIRNINRYALTAILLGTISIAYYLARAFLEPVLRTVEVSTATYTEGSGLFERLLEYQNDGLYFLVAPIKSAHLLFSLGFRIDGIINPITIYNDQVIASFCLINFIFFLSLLATRRFGLRNDLIMISIVYLVVFALTPVYAPRYFYAVTVLWALVLAGARGSIAREADAPDRALAYT